jgi:nitrate reductase NapAB chaperone NapD
MKENYSNQKKKQKRKKEKNLFNLLPKTSISDSDALGMTVVVLDSGRKKESLREGTLKRRIAG